MHRPAFSRATLLAVALSILGVIFALVVTFQVFEAIPHLEDEIAYVWQARLLAEGKLYTPSPPESKSFLVPFVIDYEGKRFGKYPLGWPLVMAAGVRLGLRWLVNPLLAGLGVWLTYWIGKRTLGERVGLLAAALTLTSPFFLMNSGSLLSHPLGLVLVGGFILAWFTAFDHRAGEGAGREWLAVLAAAFCFGFLALTRPFTAAALAAPFGLHGLYLLARGGAGPSSRGRLLAKFVVFGLAALGLALLHFAWQYAVTGDPFLNPYTLWWDYDTIGFGPGHGHSEAGHTLRQGWINTKHSLRSGWKDLFGWGATSWLFLPVGVWAARRSARAWLTGSIFPVLVAAYLAYWVGSWLYGPRYYYEGLFSLTLFSAAGIAWLAGWPLTDDEKPPEPEPQSELDTAANAAGENAWARFKRRFARLVPQGETRRRLGIARAVLVSLAVVLLVGYNLIFYLPGRMREMYGLYTIEAADLEPFLQPEGQSLAPALIIVHPTRWMPFGALLDLQDPELTSPFIFAYSRGKTVDEKLPDYFPDRAVFHYYPDDPYKFYTRPK